MCFAKTRLNFWRGFIRAVRLTWHYFANISCCFQIQNKTSIPWLWTNGSMIISNFVRKYEDLLHINRALEKAAKEYQKSLFVQEWLTFTHLQLRRFWHICGCSRTARISYRDVPPARGPTTLQYDCPNHKHSSLSAMTQPGQELWGRRFYGRTHGAGTGSIIYNRLCMS